MKKHSAKFGNWCCWLLLVLFFLILAGLTVTLAALDRKMTSKPPPAKFYTQTTPRFDISVARLADGSEVRIYFDKVARRDYLATITKQGGVAMQPLPYRYDY